VLRRHGRICAALRSAAAGGHARARVAGATVRRFSLSLSVCCMSVARCSHPRRRAHARCRMHAWLWRGSETGARRREGGGVSASSACTAAIAAICHCAARALTRCAPRAARRVVKRRCRLLWRRAAWAWCSCCWSEARTSKQKTTRCATTPRPPPRRAARTLCASILPSVAAAARRRRGGGGALAVPCARIHRGSGTASVRLAAAAPAPRTRTDAALRSSCAERRATLRRVCACMHMPPAWRACAGASIASPLPPHSKIIFTLPPHMRLGCTLLRLSPARFCCLRCTVLPCCADAAAASPSAAALRRCGCAQTRWTPLHWAAYNDHVACVALLVERGANKDAKNVVRCAAPSPAAATAVCCLLLRRRTQCAACAACTAAVSAAAEAPCFRALRVFASTAAAQNGETPLDLATEYPTRTALRTAEEEEEAVSAIRSMCVVHSTCTDVRCCRARARLSSAP
jgi:hypothetical protein